MASQPRNEQPPTLVASVHDVRYFAALLRGVHFLNRTTFKVNDAGFVVLVEEARTLLATAYVDNDMFDEYIYNPPPPPPQEPSSQLSLNSQDPDARNETSVFELPLNTLVDCLSIFGTAGVSSSSTTNNKFKKWRRADDGSDGEQDGGRTRGNARLDQYFPSGGDEKRTSMRMTYAGPGYPLTLILAEDASGPTTTCEITTFDAEPHIDFPFEDQNRVLKIILKSSWLREALSEIDPSCEKLTIVGNPSPAVTGTKGAARQSGLVKPMLRIQAAGTFGSTEMDYPNDREVLETFECREPVSFSYRLGHINRAIRALSSSSKTSLRIDAEGLLSLQFLMPSPSPKPGSAQLKDAFIEFKCLALDEDP